MDEALKDLEALTKKYGDKNPAMAGILLMLQAAIETGREFKMLEHLQPHARREIQWIKEQQQASQN